MRATSWAFVCVWALFVVSEAKGADAPTVPQFHDFIVIPLRVHILTSNDLKLANSSFRDAEATKAAAGINAIWNKAGIHFGLESIVREPAVQVPRFKAMVALNEGKYSNFDVFAYLLPTQSRVFDGLHVYVFHDLPVDAAYINAADAVILTEDPHLKAVNKGSDNPTARAAAHGLGLALGLLGRQDEDGLLSSGTTGVSLSEAEITRAREIARTIPGSLNMVGAVEMAGLATKRGDLALARLMWTWLSEIPGHGAAEAKRRLTNLPVRGEP